MSRTEVLSTCTTQLKSGAFCDAPADLRFPNRICASHAIKVYLAVRDQIPADLPLEILSGSQRDGIDETERG